MESTKQMLIQRSNNLFLPFSSESQYAIGKDIAFSSDSTLFATIMDDGNIHIHGKRSAENSGYVLLWSLTQSLVLKAGSTYNFSISATSPVQCIIQSNQSGTRTNIIQVGPNYVNGAVKTMTEDTTITHVYMAISAQASTAVGDTVDEYVNPMLVEQSTRMDYEPYYKEYEATRQVLVRRSDNMLYLRKTTSPSLNKSYAFRNNGTYITVTDENIRFNGTWDGTENTSGLWGVITCSTGFFTMKANVTYTITTASTYLGQFILQKRVDGTRVTVIALVYGKHSATFTPTEDTLVTDFFLSLDGSSLPQNTPFDFTVDPMVVENQNLLDTNTPVESGWGWAGDNAIGSKLLPITIPQKGNAGREVPFTIKDGTYTLSTKVGDGTQTVGIIDMYLRNSVTKLPVVSYSGADTKINSSYTFTISETGASSTDTFFVYYHDTTGKFAGENLYISIIEQTDASAYEPYYTIYTARHQEVNDFYPTGYVVNSNGIVVKNLVDFNALIPDKYLNNEDKVSDNSIWGYIAEYYPCDGNARYYFGMLDKNDSLLKHMLLHFYDEDKTIISTAQVLTRDGGDSMLDSLSPSNAKYMRVTMDRLDDKSSNSFPKFPYLYKEPTA